MSQLSNDIDNDNPAPRQFKGVMVSSTFTDLEKHRAALIKAIKGQGLTDVAMENDTARPGVNVVESSLQMVRDSSAYIILISRKYGQTPRSQDLNPHKVSITELEFNEALRLNRPILLFIMGDKHPLIEADVESNAAKKKKLNAFRERAKNMGPDSSVHRVYATFNSLEEFSGQAVQAVAGLRRYLDEQDGELPRPATSNKTEPDPIPKAPTFYAEPPYIGSHKFLGRKAQLDTLNDWAAPADSHPILLFEAIGGTGKSILTWEWMTNYATKVRSDWAGRFWYSFYEKGAIMSDFCQRALAYITGQPLADFRRKKTTQISEMLLHHLQLRPWLFVLDGLERVLVAYHRFDAAQVADEEAGTSDKIAHRDPCSAIRPEDDDLLRALAGAGQSKVLITSRLIPRVLLNPSSQPIPGVLRVALRGLFPAEAEELLRTCGVTGTSADIQNYLKSHCDCHPLVTGILAGLINDYLPDRGNFDAWAADPNYGGQLNLAELDLVQKRNHILCAALDALPEKGRQLLSTLALLSEAVDYLTLKDLNPHLPPEPEKVKEPEKPEDGLTWAYKSDERKEQAQREYQSSVLRRREYEQEVATRLESVDYKAAPQRLTETVRDLERRGLLQYDPLTKRHDLHPVVRGIAAGGLQQDEKERYGQRVVDHFSQQAHSPYEEAETLEDLRDGLHVVRTLLQMAHYEQACDAYSSDLASALSVNLEAHAEKLSLLRPFFLQGWATLPDTVSDEGSAWLAHSAALALKETGDVKEALVLYGASLMSLMRQKSWDLAIVRLLNMSNALQDLGFLSKAERCLLLGLNIARLIEDKLALFLTRFYRFNQLAFTGRWDDADTLWETLDLMGRSWSRVYYVPGDAECRYALFCFWKGQLMEEHLVHAEKLANAGKNRQFVRSLHSLRGEWLLNQGKWAHAVDSLHEAVRMAREVGQSDPSSETMLALARFHLGQLQDAHHEAEQLARAKDPAHRFLAELWLAIGDTEQARKHALAAYKRAWADGEPYVYRYELNKACALLEQLGAEIPNLPPYDPAKDEKLPWESEVVAAIEKLRAEKETENAAKANKKKQTRRGNRSRP